MSKTMISIQNINVIFNQGTQLEKVALHDLSLEMEEGEFACVIGGNGAGKSTLLGIVTGNIIPTKGRILFDSTDVTKFSPEKRATFIARVFQDPLKGTCGTLTVEENMALACVRGQSRGLSFATNRSRKELFSSALERLGLGLENRLSDPIGSLSGGQRQAISLVMAVLSPMKILLLDEHTAALDPKTAASIIKLTEEIVTTKKLTVLMVTHSMNQALEVGSRTLMLSEGRLIHDITGEKRSKMTPTDLMSLYQL